MAAATIHSAGWSVRLAISHIDFIMPHGMTPVPVGVSVAIRKRSKTSALTTRLRHNTAVRMLPAWHTCSAISLSSMTRWKSASGMATGPPFTWKETSGIMSSRWSPVIAEEPGMEAPPVCTLTIMPTLCAARTMGVYS